MSEQEHTERPQETLQESVDQDQVIEDQSNVNSQQVNEQTRISQLERQFSQQSSRSNQKDPSKAQPTNMILILKDLIVKTQKKSKKEQLMNLLDLHDKGELQDQEFFNKVHNIDQSFTSKAFNRINEIKTQRANPSGLGNKNQHHQLQITKRQSAQKAKMNNSSAKSKDESSLQRKNSQLKNQSQAKSIHNQPDSTSNIERDQQYAQENQGASTPAQAPELSEANDFAKLAIANERQSQFYSQQDHQMAESDKVNEQVLPDSISLDKRAQPKYFDDESKFTGNLADHQNGPNITNIEENSEVQRNENEIQKTNVKENAGNKRMANENDKVDEQLHRHMNDQKSFEAQRQQAYYNEAFSDDNQNNFVAQSNQSKSKYSQSNPYLQEERIDDGTPVLSYVQSQNQVPRENEDEIIEDKSQDIEINSVDKINHSNQQEQIEQISNHFGPLQENIQNNIQNDMKEDINHTGANIEGEMIDISGEKASLALAERACKDADETGPNGPAKTKMQLERMNTRHQGQRGDKNYADMLNPPTPGINSYESPKRKQKSEVKDSKHREGNQLQKQKSLKKQSSMTSDKAHAKHSGANSSANTAKKQYGQSLQISQRPSILGFADEDVPEVDSCKIADIGTNKHQEIGQDRNQQEGINEASDADVCKNSSNSAPYQRKANSRGGESPGASPEVDRDEDECGEDEQEEDGREEGEEEMEDDDNLNEEGEEEQVEQSAQHQSKQINSNNISSVNIVDPAIKKEPQRIFATKSIKSKKSLNPANNKDNIAVSNQSQQGHNQYDADFHGENNNANREENIDDNNPEAERKKPGRQSKRDMDKSQDRQAESADDKSISHQDNPQKEEAAPNQIQSIDARQQEKPTAQALIPPYFLQPSQIILDQKSVRAKIKRRMQAQGLYDFKKQKREQIVESVNECERLVQEVLKVQIGSMIQDLINIQRHRQSVQDVRRPDVLPSQETLYEYVTQKEQLKYNLSTIALTQGGNNPAGYQQNGFMDPFTGERMDVYSMMPPKKNSLDLVCFENTEVSHIILEKEERRRQILSEQKKEQEEEMERQRLIKHKSKSAEADQAPPLQKTQSTNNLLPGAGQQQDNSNSQNEQEQKAPLGVLPPVQKLTQEEIEQRNAELQRLSGKQYDIGYTLLKNLNQQNILHLDAIQDYAKNPDSHNQTQASASLSEFNQNNNAMKAKLNLQVFDSREHQPNKSDLINTHLEIQQSYLKNQINNLKKQQSQQYETNIINSSSGPSRNMEITAQLQELQKMDKFQSKFYQDKVNIRDLVVYLGKQSHERGGHTAGANLASAIQPSKLTQILYEVLNTNHEQ